MSDGHDVVLEPLLQFQPIISHRPKISFEAIALTSATALSFCDLSDHLDTPVFTTGDATRQTAHENGFNNVQSAEGGALELVTLIGNYYRDQTARILYPRADKAAQNLRKLLEPKQIECVNWSVYRTTESDNFSISTLELFIANKINLVLLYSQRTALCFAKLWEQHMDSTRPPRLLAISQNVKESLPQKLAQNCFVSQEPNESSMTDLIKDISVQD